MKCICSIILAFFCFGLTLNGAIAQSILATSLQTETTACSDGVEPLAGLVADLSSSSISSPAHVLTLNSLSNFPDTATISLTGLLLIPPNASSPFLSFSLTPTDSTLLFLSNQSSPTNNSQLFQVVPGEYLSFSLVAHSPISLQWAFNASETFSDIPDSSLVTCNQSASSYPLLEYLLTPPTPTPTPVPTPRPTPTPVSAPTILRARFSDSGDSVSVLFDLNMKRPQPVATSPLLCSSLFDASSLTALGSVTKCFWSDSSTLSLHLGPLSTLSFNQSLTMINGSAFATNGRFLPQTSFVVLAPVHPATPSIVIEGPTRLGSTASLLLDASATTNVGGRLTVATFLWTISPVPPGGSFFDGLSTLYLTGTAELPAGTYTATLRVTSWLGTSSFASFQFTKFSSQIPSVQIRGPPSITTTRANAITLQGWASFDNELVYRWSVTPEPDFSFTSNQSVLHLSPQSLSPIRNGGHYLVRLTVSVANAPSISNYAEANVFVRLSPLVAAIRGGDRVIQLSKPSSFDSAASYDPDYTNEPETFSWRCALFLMPNVTCGNTTTRFLNLTAGAIPRNQRATITLVYSKGLRNATASVVVASVLGAFPVVGVQPLGRTKIQRSERLVLEATIQPPPYEYLAVSSMTWQGLDSSGFEIPTSSFLTPIENRVKVVVRPNALKSGEVYTFRFQARNSALTPGTANVTVTVNEPPSGGICSATPPQGTYLETPILLSCASWTDPDGPLSYSFSYRYDDANETYILSPPSLSSSLLTQSLPLPTTSSLTIIAKIYDSFGDFSIFEFPVRINAPGSLIPASSTLPSTAVFTAVKGVVDGALAQGIKVGDVSGPCSVVSSLALLLNQNVNMTLAPDQDSISLRERMIQSLSLITDTSELFIPQKIEAIAALTASSYEISNVTARGALNLLSSVIESSSTTISESLSTLALRTVSNVFAAQGVTSEQESTLAQRIIALLSSNQLSNAIAGEEPVQISVSGLTLIARRESPTNFPLTLSAFQLPSSIFSDSILSNFETVDVHQSYWTNDLFSWKQPDLAVNSPIVSLSLFDSLTNLEIPIFNLSSPIVVSLPMDVAPPWNASSPSMCSFWNETMSFWSTEGCSVQRVENTTVYCACNHLTAFVSREYQPPPPPPEPYIPPPPKTFQFAAQPVAWFLLSVYVIYVGWSLYGRHKDREADLRREREMRRRSEIELQTAKFADLNSMAAAEETPRMTSLATDTVLNIVQLAQNSSSSKYQQTTNANYDIGELNQPGSEKIRKNSQGIPGGDLVLTNALPEDTSVEQDEHNKTKVAFSDAIQTILSLHYVLTIFKRQAGDTYSTPMRITVLASVIIGAAFVNAMVYHRTSGGMWQSAVATLSAIAVIFPGRMLLAWGLKFVAKRISITAAIKEREPESEPLPEEVAKMNAAPVQSIEAVIAFFTVVDPNQDRELRKQDLEAAMTAYDPALAVQFTQIFNAVDDKGEGVIKQSKFIERIGLLDIAQDENEKEILNAFVHNVPPPLPPPPPPPPTGVNTPATPATAKTTPRSFLSSTSSSPPASRRRSTTNMHIDTEQDFPPSSHEESTDAYPASPHAIDEGSNLREDENDFLMSPTAMMLPLPPKTSSSFSSSQRTFRGASSLLFSESEGGGVESGTQQEGETEGHHEDPNLHQAVGHVPFWKRDLVQRVLIPFLVFGALSVCAALFTGQSYWYILAIALSSLAVSSSQGLKWCLRIAVHEIGVLAAFVVTRQIEYGLVFLVPASLSWIGLCAATELLKLGQWKFLFLTFMVYMSTLSGFLLNYVAEASFWRQGLAFSSPIVLGVVCVRYFERGRRILAIATFFVVLGIIGAGVVGMSDDTDGIISTTGVILACSLWVCGGITIFVALRMKREELVDHRWPKWVVQAMFAFVCVLHMWGIYLTLTYVLMFESDTEFLFFVSCAAAFFIDAFLIEPAFVGVRGFIESLRNQTVLILKKRNPFLYF